VGLVGGMMLYLLPVTPGLAESPPESERAGKTEQGKRAAEALSIELVVDAVVKRTWTPEDLPRLAAEKWRGPRGTTYPAIPLWTLLTEGGVSRDTVIELRVIGARGTVTLKGPELERVDQFVLKNDDPGFAKAWELRSRDSIRKRGPSGVSGVRRVEVVTTGAPK